MQYIIYMAWLLYVLAEGHGDPVLTVPSGMVIQLLLDPQLENVVSIGEGCPL